MTSPSSEPTKLVQIFGNYQSQVKSSMGLGSVPERLADKRPLATRLTFDDTFEDFQAPKIPKLNRDPFDSVTGRKRFASEHAGAQALLVAENQQLKDRMKALEAERAGDLAKYTRLENRLEQAQLNFKKDQIELERKLEKATRLYKAEAETRAELEHRINKLKEKKDEKDERAAESRRQSLDRADALENKVRALRADRSQLQEKVAQLQAEVNRRSEIDPVSYSTQVQNYETELARLRFQLEESETRNRTLQRRIQDHQTIVAEHRDAKEECVRYRNKVEQLQAELEANRDAVVQRRAMQDKLEQFNQMERDNMSLRSRNQLLLQTQENVGLLKEQICSLTAEKERAERRAKDRDTVRADLELARQELKGWLDLLVSVAPADQRANLARDGLQAARDILGAFQCREVESAAGAGELRTEVSLLQGRLQRQGDRNRELEVELGKVKGEQAEQTRLIRKLQRKLLLVTKERDATKGILDSVEKEMTLSGNQWEQQKIQGLERTLEEYRAMVNLLIDKDDGEDRAVPQAKVAEVVEAEARTAEAEAKLAEVELLRTQLREAEEKCQRFELELERRAIKGDFNPADTKVIHFLRNPTSVAVEKRRVETEELLAEIDALKARIHLLEEGQTKDITMMVGHRLEEGASSKEVQELKEQVKTADLKNQRIIEAFKKTSKDFREFVFQTTGFRIDKIPNNMYKLSPMYAETSNSYLIFEQTQDGVHMLESEFSLELGDLMEQHLEHNNSIPMFLAGLIMELFRNQQVEAEENEEDDEGEGEVEDEEEQEEEEEAGDNDEARSEGSAASSDVICVEDD